MKPIKWIQNVKSKDKKGATHRMLHIPMTKKIPTHILQHIVNSSKMPTITYKFEHKTITIPNTPLLQKRVRLDLTLAKLRGER